MTAEAFFSIAERLAQRPLLSDEQRLTADWAPPSRLLDELRVPLWWTPSGLTMGCRS